MALALANPITTFVSAFLDLREDRSKDKGVERCFGHFDVVAASGIPIHLFLSRSYEELWAERAHPNVTVEWIELEDLDTYKEVLAAEEAVGQPMGLPQQRTPHHDTRNFMILMNCKAELVGRVARSLALTTQVAWLDFSIAHVFKDVGAALNSLRLLAHTRLKDSTRLAFPGCWYRGAHHDNLFGGINWRFCGGFFIGGVSAATAFADLYRSAWPTALRSRRCLTWEVNFWHWLECEAAAVGSPLASHSPTFVPTWFPADHNDSIVRVPPTLFHVVASLTTIPPRLADGSCKAAIDSVLGQVDTVYLTIPLEYGRFPGEVSLPAWLGDAPYSSRVIVVRPPVDAGPAAKYLGALEAIPAGSWIFVCDDDQEYRDGLVGRMLPSVKQLAVVQNHLLPIRAKTSGGLVHGYVGLLVPRAALEGLGSFPLPPAAKFVDDQWMSIFCHKTGLPVAPSGVEQYSDIFAVLEGGWHEKLGSAALSGLSNRDEKVAEIAAAFGVQFLPGGEISSV